MVRRVPETHTEAKGVRATHGGDLFQLVAHRTGEEGRVLMAGHEGVELVAADTEELAVLAADSLLHCIADGSAHGADGVVASLEAVELVDATEVVAIHADVNALLGSAEEVSVGLLVAHALDHRVGEQLLSERAQMLWVQLAGLDSSPEAREGLLQVRLHLAQAHEKLLRLLHRLFSLMVTDCRMALLGVVKEQL